MVQPDRPRMTIRRMRIACLIPKATDTHREHCFFQVTIVRRTTLDATRVRFLSCYYCSSVSTTDFLVVQHIAHSLRQK
jgi:hypothetical protein